MKLTKLLLLFTALFFLKNSCAQTTLRIETGTKIKFPTKFFPKDDLSNDQIDFFVSFIPEISGGSFGKFIPEIQYSLQSFLVKNLDETGFRTHYFRFIPQWDLLIFERQTVHFGASVGKDYFTEIRRESGAWSESQWKHTPIVDVGWIVGTRFFWNNWVLRLRYYHGFSLNEIETDIFNVSFNGFKTIRYKYRNIQIGVGYTFN